MYSFSAFSARHLLLMVVLALAGAATLFGATPRRAAADEGPVIELPSKYFVQVCKDYQSVGPLDDKDRTFVFDISITGIENAPGIVHTYTHTITLNEGEVKCLPSAHGFRPQGTVTVTERLDLTPSFVSAATYPRVSFEQNGPVAAQVPGNSWTFATDEHCAQASPCVVTFHNRQPGPTLVPIKLNPVSIRICKHHLDNSDGFTRPETEFTFLVNGSWHAISVAEGESACTVVGVLLQDMNNPINIIETVPGDWENSSQYPKKKVDSFPVMSSPEHGSFGSVITIKVNNGCSAGLDPFANPLPGFGQQVQGLTSDDALCTVYFFNREPARRHSCLFECQPPLCARGEPCVPGGCENDPGCGPVCRVMPCDPPGCTVDCDPPQQCLADCEPPACTAGCDDPADPPTTPGDPPVTPPSTPQSDVQGESTPGPQPTPLAPKTGETVQSAPVSANLLAALGIAVLIVSGLVTAAAVSRRD